MNRIYKRPRLENIPPVEALMFDLDGTLYRGNEKIPGADRLIEGLRSKPLPCLFVTNNSTRTALDVAEHLRKMGILAEEESIVTSAQAAADYIRSHHPEEAVYMIGENGLRMALRDAGVELLEAESADRQAGVVVQGLDRKLDYDRIATALRHLLGGAAFVQTNPDRLLPVDGGFLPGAGAIGAVLQASSGAEPLVIGKPSSILMNYALKQADAHPNTTWVIGDNPYTDLAAARNTGCPSILVLTGLCTLDNWEEHCRQADVAPDAVCENLQQLEQLFTEMLV